MAVSRIPHFLAASTLAATAACSGGAAAPEPLETTPAGATETPSATATATPDGPPELPEAAQGTGRKAAVAFVRHWIDTLNYSSLNGDTTVLHELSAGDCSACRSAADSIERVFDGDGEIRGHHWNVADAWVGNARRGLIQVVAVVEIAPTKVRLRPDARWQRFEGGRIVYILDVQRSEDELRIKHIAGDP